MSDIVFVLRGSPVSVVRLTHNGIISTGQADAFGNYQLELPRRTEEILSGGAPVFVSHPQLPVNGSLTEPWHDARITFMGITRSLPVNDIWYVEFAPVDIYHEGPLRVFEAEATRLQPENIGAATHPGIERY